MGDSFIFPPFLSTFVIAVAAGSIVFTVFLFFRRRHVLEDAGIVAPRRMTRQQLLKLPVRGYLESDEGETCCICIEDFAQGDEIVTLPCNHIFHKQCITPW